MEKSVLYSKVFTWLAIGLMITFASGYAISLNNVMLANILSGNKYIILIILQIAIAIFFGVRIRKMSKVTAIICYLLYSLLTGVTFSGIFVVFKMSSIISMFLVTSIVFGLFAAIGFTTKRDLSRFGNILFMALIGVILISIINIFMKSSGLEIILSIVCMLIFIGYIMFDIRNLETYSLMNEEAGPIYGAFQLYIDFINLFIRLLELFGDTRD